MQKSYQATAPTTRQRKQRLKEGQLITAVTDAQLHFQKHKNPNMVY
jgi:hypothetical protein